MADVFANQANLLLTALFFHPLLPVSIPIALVATIFSYWTNKVSSFFLTFSLVFALEESEASRRAFLVAGHVLRELTPMDGVYLVTESVLILPLDFQ